MVTRVKPPGASRNGVRSPHATGTVWCSGRCVQPGCYVGRCPLIDHSLVLDTGHWSLHILLLFNGCWLHDGPGSCGGQVLGVKTDHHF
jgi:hypothetical protein